MKRIVTICILSAFSGAVLAQPSINKPGSHYKMTPVKVLEALPVDDQGQSNTCWTFSSLSFLEAEMNRMGKTPVNFSEMFVVNKAYKDKADVYVRTHGNNTFAAGGAFHDIIYVWQKYGLVPQVAYLGRSDDEKKLNHFEMDALLVSMMKTIVAEGDKKSKLSTHWKPAIDAVVDAYLGATPEKFEYMGKQYTPSSFAQSLGLNPDDYVEIGSYSHHPFYKQFAIEIPDNWMHDKIYNLPINEFSQVLENAITNGYSIAWGSDVSDKGFSNKNGLAIVPDADWNDISKAAQDTIFNSPVKQKTITQAIRQQAFDNYETQDDHGMHLIGLYKDQMDQKYYLVKNSWGSAANEAGGYFFASEAFVLYKSTSIMVHKKALPLAIAQKLGIKQ